MFLRMNNQFTTLEAIASERKHLVGIREERDRLAETVESKRREFARDEAELTMMQTPAGLMNTSDKQIEAQEKAVATRRRAVARAGAELQAYETGPAEGLGGKLAELDRAEFDLKHAAARAVYEEALQAQVDRLLQAAVKERELVALARAAGCGRAPVGLLASEFGEATPGDRWLREVGAINPELLPADNPQRQFAERARGCPEAAA